MCTSPPPATEWQTILHHRPAGGLNFLSSSAAAAYYSPSYLCTQPAPVTGSDDEMAYSLHSSGGREQNSSGKSAYNGRCQVHLQAICPQLDSQGSHVTSSWHTEQELCWQTSTQYPDEDLGAWHCGEWAWKHHRCFHAWSRSAYATITGPCIHNLRTQYNFEGIFPSSTAKSLSKLFDHTEMLERKQATVCFWIWLSIIECCWRTWWALDCK